MREQGTSPYAEALHSSSCFRFLSALPFRDFDASLWLLCISWSNS